MEASALVETPQRQAEAPAVEGGRKLANSLRESSDKIKRNPERGKGTPEVLEKLLKDIASQAEKVRAKKAEEGEGEKWRKKAVMAEIFKLLDLKHKYCALSPVPITEESHPELYVPVEPPHVIKLRWKIRLAGTELTRLQRPFHDVTYLTGREILDTIKQQTHKPRKHSALNGFLKVEVKDADTGHWLAVIPEDHYTLPLEFPGPVLKPLWLLDVRVTWPEKASHLSTPAAYDNCKRIPELVDAGVNLFEKPLCDEIDQLCNRAFGAGVSQLVAIATTPENSKFSVDLCATRHGSLYTTVGVHPGRVAEVPLEDIAKLKELVVKHRGYVIAIGECGLDVKEEKEDRVIEDEDEGGEAAEPASAPEEEGKGKEKEKEAEATTTATASTSTSSSCGTRTGSIADLDLQLKWLESQIQLAIELDMPLFFHERGAHEEFMKLMYKYQDKIRGRAVINCFTGTAEELRHFLDLDFYVGITGIICNAARGVPLREVIKNIPLDRVVLGSDAPYLTPFTMPRPYPKINEPAFMPHTLVLAAECLGVTPEVLAEAATANTRKLFGLPVLPFDGTIRTKPSLQAHSPNVIMGICKMRPKKAKVEPKKEAEGEKEAASGEGGEKPVFFIHKGKKYSCTAKEKVILVNQQKGLDKAGFDKLFTDFALQEYKNPNAPVKAKRPPKKRKPRNRRTKN